MDDARVAAGANAERHRLRHRRDVHAGEELVDHLYLRALSRPVPEAVDLGGDRPEHVVARGEYFRRAGGHDRHLAGRGLRCAAGNGRVEEPDPPLGEPRAEPLDVIRRRSHAHDHDASPRHRAGRPVPTEQHALGLIGVHDEDRDRLAFRPELCRTRARGAARGGEGVERLFSDVAGMSRKALAQERARGAHSHRAEADDADATAGHVGPQSVLTTLPASSKPTPRALAASASLRAHFTWPGCLPPRIESSVWSRSPKIAEAPHHERRDADHVALRHHDVMLALVAPMDRPRSGDGDEHFLGVVAVKRRAAARRRDDIVDMEVLRRGDRGLEVRIVMDPGADDVVEHALVTRHPGVRERPLARRDPPPAGDPCFHLGGRERFAGRDVPVPVA